MWVLSTEWYELVLRAFCVFSFLLVAFRLWGKKHLGELAPFDFILLLIISESVQNALIDDDKSITGGMITITTLIGLNIILNRLTYRFSFLERIIDGVPKVLINNGILDKILMKKEKLTDQELHEALRQQGVETVHDVKKATIETDGKISVIKQE